MTDSNEFWNCRIRGKLRIKGIKSTGSDLSGNFTFTADDLRLGEGNYQAKLYCNANTLDAGEGKDILDIYSMGVTKYDNWDEEWESNSNINAGAGNDLIMGRGVSIGNVIDAGAGNDTIFVGGDDNYFKGGSGIDTFVMSRQNISSTITDISNEDLIVFDRFSSAEVWFEKHGDHLSISTFNGNIKDAPEWFSQYAEIEVFDYFKSSSNRARIVTSAKVDANGETVSYNYLDNNTIDKLIEIMATSDKGTGDIGLMQHADNDFRKDVQAAWADTKNYTKDV